MQVILPDSLRAAALRHLLHTREVETHAFLFGVSRGDTIRAARLWVTPGDAYDHRSATRVELRRDYVVSALEYARRNSFSIIDMHSHPWDTDLYFSHTDDEYGLANARWTQDKVVSGAFPAIDWGMIVVSGRHELLARIYRPDKSGFADAAIRSPLAPPGDDATLKEDGAAGRHTRQLALWGEQGQKRLSRARVAVVGLGGLGVLLAEYLSRIGVRRLTLFDGDRVDESNLSRLPGFYPRHIGQMKVDVVASSVRRLWGEQAEVVPIPEFLSRDTLSRLERHDLIIGAVDREGARLLLNESSVRFLIPYLDVATGITIDDSATVANMGGQIRFVNPGTTPCLQCYDKGIDLHEAALDLMPAGDREVRRHLGYVDGTDLSPEPSVLPQNGILASLAAQEVSRLLTQFAIPRTYIYYDGLANSIRLMDTDQPLTARPSCSVCGAGGLLGLADLPMQVYATAEETEVAKAALPLS